MNAYIDVRDATGAMLAGWLWIVDFELTNRMDGAGAFSCTLVVNARTATIAVKTTVDIYAYTGSTYALVGSGTVDRIEQTVDANGITLLRIAGDNQVRELAQRTAGFLSLSQVDTLGTWEKIKSFGTATQITAILALTSDEILVGITGGIYRSADGGDTWSIVHTTSASYRWLAFLNWGEGVVLAIGDGTNSARSTDNGVSWTVTARNGQCMTASSTSIWLGADLGNVYKSTDAGVTWGAAVNVFGTYTVMDILYLGSGVLLAVSQNAATPCKRSTDSGATWSDITMPAGSNTYGFLSLLSPATDIVLAGSDIGFVCVSDDNGASFALGEELETSGDTTPPIWDLAIYDTYIIASSGTTAAVLFISPDNGGSWTELTTLGAGVEARGLGASGTAVFAGNDIGGLYRGISTIVGMTHAGAVAALAALAPAGWSFVADGSPPNDSILMDFAGESVLAAALMIAERSGVHCYLSASRTLTFTDSWTASGLRAAGPLLAQTLNSLICGIVALTVEQESFDVVTRCYPYSKSLHNIGVATVSPGTGYTKSTTSLYVQHTAALATYGTIEATIIFDDITEPEVAASEALEETANALVAAAVRWLAQRIAPITNYRISLAHCTQLLLPMQTIAINYRTEHYSLTATLNILETTWRGDAAGIQTTEIIASDGTYWIDSDETTLARTVQRVNVLAAK